MYLSVPGLNPSTAEGPQTLPGVFLEHQIIWNKPTAPYSQMLCPHANPSTLPQQLEVWTDSLGAISSSCSMNLRASPGLSFLDSDLFSARGSSGLLTITEGHTFPVADTALPYLPLQVSLFLFYHIERDLWTLQGKILLSIFSLSCNLDLGTSFSSISGLAQA